MSTPNDNSGKASHAPRAAAIAGVLFAVLLTISMILIRRSMPGIQPALTNGTSYAAALQSLNVGLNCLPFAGIAFLWFIGVIRDYIGEHEDRFLATVILGSGLLFLATLFAAAGSADGLLTALKTGIVNDETYQFGRAASYTLAYVYAARMAGVFMISTTTLTLRAGIMPRWMEVIGYLFALVLLIGISRFEWILLLFPLWVILVSVDIFNARSPHA